MKDAARLHRRSLRPLVSAAACLGAACFGAACFGDPEREAIDETPSLDGVQGTGIGPAGAASGTRAGGGLTGVWTVTGHALSAAAAMDGAEASAWRGRTIRLVDWEAQAPGARCAEPEYRTTTEAAGTFVARFESWPPDLVLPIQAGQVEVMTVRCEGRDWVAPGGTVIRVDAARALTVWDGVFFSLERDLEAEAVDFRGTGNEPGWPLDVDDGRRIRFLYDYGEAEVVVPAPDPEVDAATGAREYRPGDGPEDLRVRIAPEPCTDDMSGFAFPATVTVTLGERTFRGCGGPAPAVGDADSR